MPKEVFRIRLKKSCYFTYGVGIFLVEVLSDITEMALGNMFRRRKSWTLEPVCLPLILMYVNSVVSLTSASVT